MDNLTIWSLTTPLILNELMASETYGIVGSYNTYIDRIRRKKSENYRLLTFIAFNMALGSYFYLINPKIIGVQLIVSLLYFYGYYHNISPNYEQKHINKTIYELSSYILLFGIMSMAIIYNNIKYIAIVIIFYGLFVCGSIYALKVRYNQMNNNTEDLYISLAYYAMTLSMIFLFSYILCDNNDVIFNGYIDIYIFLSIIAGIKNLYTYYVITMM